MEFTIWFAAKAAAPGGAGIFVQFLPFVIIFGLFWLLILRPQRKREKEHQDLLNTLKKGDKIVTNSGFFGEVYSINQQTAVIELAPKVKITIQRSAIAGIVAPEQYASIQQNNPAPSSSSRNEEGKSGKTLKKKKK